MINFLIVLIFCFISSLYLSGLGVLTNKFVYKIEKIDNGLEFVFLGIFSLSFIGLFANFFTSLNLFFNSIIFIFSIVYLIFLDRKILISIIKFSLFISLISFLTMVLDYTNRPDSALYHLPFTSMLNEHKLIIGSANLNERFGIVSILQYLSAANYNFLFSENGILIPLVIIYSSCLLFFLINILDNKKKDFIRILSFLFFIFTLTNLNRYSGFGNDAPAHLFYFILIYYFLENENKYFVDKNFKLIVLLSVYIFLIKPFFILLFILPLLFLFKNFRDIKIFSLNNIFCSFFLLIWISKNILITGCFLYPLDFTCIKDIDWSLDPTFISLEAEAWTKGWPDRENKDLNFEEYLENFYWVKIWLNNHLKIILAKLSPFLIILIILSTIIYFKNNKKIINLENKYYQLAVFNLILLIIWFFTFPNYRFGLGIIGSFISLNFIIIFSNRLDLKNIFFYRSIIFFIFLSSLIIILKNLDRISENYSLNYTDHPWPRKNSHYSSNNKLVNVPVKLNGQILYYRPPSGELCFYSKAPCTHKTNLKIKKQTVFKYFKKYTIDNK